MQPYDSSDAPGAAPAWLLGRWRLLRADVGLDFAPGVMMDFRSGGRLGYTITVEGQAHELALVYRVEGDVLRTDNPAAPHATATRFWQGEGGVLVFDFAGPLAVFVHEEG